MSVTKVSIAEIQVLDRIRKDNGEINDLAKSIEEHGLINPITIMESDDKYVLIAGFRRLSAMKILGWTGAPATVLSPMDAEEQLRIEIEENETRKEFTPSERLEYAEKLRTIEEAKAKERMNWRAQKGSVKDAPADGWDRGPTHKHRARDEIAQKVGFKSGRQLDRAKYVAKNRPDLMIQVDEGKKSITRAYEESKGIERKKPVEKMELPPNMGQIHGMLGHIDSDFTRPDGFPFVLEQVQTAAKYYLAEIRKAAIHYAPVMQNLNNSKEVSALLRETFYEAAEAFGDNYIEENEDI